MKRVVHQYILSSLYAVCIILCIPSFSTIHAKPLLYDLIIEKGQIVDGTGSHAYQADMAVKNGVIKKIGNLESATALKRVNAVGKIVSPGFIDLHSHSDDYRGAKRGLRSSDVRRRQAVNIVTQGVTTVLVNPDGFSFPGLTIAQQRAELEAGGVALNVALMVAHNAVRMHAMKDNYRRLATVDEIAAMRAFTKQGMKEGAFGLTSGLEYIPGLWSNSAEVMALVEEIAPYKGTHISHIRSETTAPMWWAPSQHDHDPVQLMDAVTEIINIAEKTDTRGVVTHMKVRGTTHWGQSADVIKLITDAKARGVDIFGDQYPYNTSGSDGRIVFIPDWVYGVDTGPQVSYEGIDLVKAVKDALSDDKKRADLYSDIEHAVAFRGGAENIVIFDYPDASLAGRSLQDIATERQIGVVDLIINLQFEGYHDKAGGARIRSFSLHDDDMVKLMQQDWVATASDGGVSLSEDGPATHARYYGTFPRKIGYYSRERGVISLEHAVRSMTGLPAHIMGLKTRGLLKEGMVADITIFDYDMIVDRSTFENPHQYSSGIEHVFVNGEAVLSHGKPTKALPGKTLYYGKD